MELQLDREGIGGYIEHDRDLFDDETVDYLAGDLEGLLGQLYLVTVVALLVGRMGPRRPDASG